MTDIQPELFAQHYAEAALVEKPVACSGKVGRRSAAWLRSCGLEYAHNHAHCSPTPSGSKAWIEALA